MTLLEQCQASINEHRNKVSTGELTTIAQCFDNLVELVDAIASAAEGEGATIVEKPNYPQG